MSSTERLSFNNTDIGRIGFGCWQMAGAYTSANGKPNGYGNIDDQEAVRAVHTALDNGINFFDTATGYNNGRSEEMLGSALKTYSGTAEAVICTKYAGAAGSNEDDFSGANMVRSVEGSLRRLQVDRLEALLLHNPPDDFDFSSFDTAPFERLIAEGKLQSYGVSCRTIKGVANVLKHGFGSVTESVYNVLDRRYAAYFDNQDFSRYTFICRVPLASGFISPRTLTEDRTFPGNDIRSGFNPEQVAWVTDAVRKVSFLNDLQGGITVSALRFQISNVGNTITIPGIKNVKQANDAALAMQLGPLPANVLERIASAIPEVFHKWK